MAPHTGHSSQPFSDVNPEILACMQMILPCEEGCARSGKVANSQPVISTDTQWVTLSDPNSREDCGLTQVDSLQQALKTGLGPKDVQPRIGPEVD